MRPGERKTEIITIRCTMKEKDMLERNAKKLGKNLSNFLLDSGFACLERRRDKDKKRLQQMIKNQEILNIMHECVASNNVSLLRTYIEEMERGELSLWDY